MLPAPPGLVRRSLQRRPWLGDLLPTVLYVLFAGLLATASAGDPDAAPLWIAVVLAVPGTATAFFSRRRPVLMFAAATLLFLVSAATSTTAELLLVLLALYAIGANRSPRAAWTSFGLGTGGAALAAFILTVRSRTGPLLLEPTQPPNSGDLFSDWLNNTIGITLTLLIATLIGTNVGGRKRYIGALLDRARHLERERDQQSEIASARERERIAREMHDIIAHSLSVMIFLADGAYAAAPGRPGQSREAMGRVADTGRTTLAEVRRLLGAVRTTEREHPADHAPQPGAAQLGHLADDIRRAGLPVQLTTAGPPITDPALGLTVYRIVQESLTNALRHAHGASKVTVLVATSGEAVDITVDDDAPSGPAGNHESEPGRGILGIRERAALYGGAVAAGPRKDGGWRLQVRLPWTGEPT
ncbi:ATPase [Arthrobacter sp. AFG7.2]|uniref:sensor histidine kinase n=1 Tax=Arthrobacter sp. AFG7.2 TaxID=1688693 RepID=UPI000C9DD0FA|nr:histidine kinase [Arthrobacter sp. AFG7.2]PNI09470.1 ATPase [Arthrobacter sp. AFG7.2]